MNESPCTLLMELISSWGDAGKPGMGLIYPQGKQMIFLWNSGIVVDLFTDNYQDFSAIARIVPIKSIDVNVMVSDDDRINACFYGVFSDFAVQFFAIGISCMNMDVGDQFFHDASIKSHL